MSAQNAHQFKFNTIDGNAVSLSDFKGKVLLIVNTASQCGFTPQYSQLQKLHEDYSDKGLVIIGVPSDNFGGQEFDEEESVKKFTEKDFSITFQLTEITNVKGKEIHPFYQWANKKSGFIGSPKWNFHKYLIDKQGNFVSWFSSATSPTSKKVIRAIEKELEKV